MVRFCRRTAALFVLGSAVFALTQLPPLQGAARAAAPTLGAGNGPIDITADQLEVVDAENRAVWRGNVEAIQGTSRLRSPSLTIYFAKAAPGAAASSGPAPGLGWGQIQRMEADGPVYYVTPQQNARGDHATYDAATNTIVMTGNVVLVQDKNVVQGDHLEINTLTNHSTLISNPQGPRKRVRGVFYSNQASQQGAASAPVAKP